MTRLSCVFALVLFGAGCGDSTSSSVDGNADLGDGGSAGDMAGSSAGDGSIGTVGCKTDNDCDTTTSYCKITLNTCASGTADPQYEIQSSICTPVECTGSGSSGCTHGKQCVSGVCQLPSTGGCQTFQCSAQCPLASQPHSCPICLCPVCN